MSPFIPVIWTDITGQRFSFETAPIGMIDYFDRSGVYIFCKEASAGQFEAIYIGETNSFQRRLGTELVRHHQWNSIRASGATHIGTLYVPGDLTLRETIETNLRRAIPTPCNLQINWLRHFGLPGS